MQDLPPIKVTCPDCCGVISLDRDAETGHLRYICQVGHAYSIEEIAVAKEGQVENAVWTVVNQLKHTELIYTHLLDEVRRGQLPIDAQPLEARVRQSQQHRRILQTLLDETDRPSLGHPELNAESFGHE